MRCSSCGYSEQWHELGTRKCPAETADKNGRRGTLKASPPDDPALWPEIIRRDSLARKAKTDAARAVYVPEIVLPPQVAARPPRGPGEIAGYQGKQAVGLGRVAVVAGWDVGAWYWRAYDGVEGCAVRLSLKDLRGVATWKRAAGKLGSKSGWSGEDAYGWKLGTMPIKLKHTELERIVSA